MRPGPIPRPSCGADTSSAGLPCASAQAPGPPESCDVPVCPVPVAARQGATTRGRGDLLWVCAAAQLRVWGWQGAKWQCRGGCPLPSQPLQLGKGSLAGMGCPSAGGRCQAHPSRRLCPLLCPWHCCLGTACAGVEGWAGVSVGTLGQYEGPILLDGVPFPASQGSWRQAQEMSPASIPHTLPRQHPSPGSQPLWVTSPV